MARGVPKNIVVFNSANSSTYTSGAIYVGDAATLSVSVTTVNAVASTVSIEGSNDHGLDDSGAVTNWSVVTALTAYPFIGTIDPGLRWVRFRRFSNESTASVILQTWNT